jgi:hypothetical protein
MTNKEPKHRDWIKLWIKDSLLGSIREDLTAEERSIWVDFLLLAGNSRVPGVICSNKTTPINVKRIAGMLNVDVELITECIKTFENTGRIEVDRKGIITICNWSKYQYSDYDRQKPYRLEKREKTILEQNQDYLQAHPEEIFNSASHELMTAEEEEEDLREYNVPDRMGKGPGGIPNRKHDEALAKKFEGRG